MLNFGKCKDCSQKVKTDVVEASLVDAEHISAFHKLEVNDLFYFLGEKVEIREIKDKNGHTVKVLCVED